MQEHWRRAGFTLVGVALGESVPHSGMPDARDVYRVDLGGDDYVKQRCNETAERATVLFRTVAELLTLASPHLPAVQFSALLLRMCGCGKLRVRKAAASFDHAMLECYRELASLDAFSSTEAAQCQLPLRDGGRGLRSQERLG